MAKKTFYFPHDSNARNDDKIIAVRMRHKMEGYGVYFAILERILESSNYMCVKDYNLIAFDLHVSSELIKSIIENFGLFKFTEDGEFFYSESFNDRMKKMPKHLKRLKVRVRMYKYNIKEWHRLSRQIFERDGYTCKYCGSVGGILEVDHIIPFSKGGTDDLSNLTTSCRMCNRQKKNKSVEEFLLWQDQRNKG